MGVNLSGQVPANPSTSGIVDQLQPGGQSLGQALSSGFTGLLSGIGDALKGIFDVGGIFAPIGEAAATFTDGQTALNDRVDLLSPLQDYGSLFMPANLNKSGAQVVPFTEQIGPMKGCEKHDNGIRLLDKGLWDIRAQITVSWIMLLSDTTVWDVEVYAPDGTLFSCQEHMVDTSDSITMTMVSSVVVPEANYVVKVRIKDMAATRAIVGGSAASRLTVQHIDRDITGGNAGTDMDAIPEKKLQV